MDEDRIIGSVMFTVGAIIGLILGFRTRRDNGTRDNIHDKLLALDRTLRESYAKGNTELEQLSEKVSAIVVMRELEQRLYQDECKRSERLRKALKMQLEISGDYEQTEIERFVSSLLEE